MDYNSATIAGRLTRDPELKSLPSGMMTCSFGLATSYRRNDQDETEYHNIVVFGKTAELCGRFLSKGKICLVEGRLQTRSWDKDGVKHYRTEIIANQVKFGPRTSDEPHREQRVVPEYPEEEIDPEDIPF
jgi:single-strand DNA-binding protein